MCSSLLTSLEHSAGVRKLEPPKNTSVKLRGGSRAELLVKVSEGKAP